jgi:glutathione S-transferase
MADATDIILHHFDSSPFAEKVRIAFGIKGVVWRSVEVPKLMPKPALTALTGGYRRVPVMQVGADIYCDSQLIIREVDNRFREPTLFSSGRRGMPFALGMWTDRAFFMASIGLITANFGETYTEEYKKDRAQLLGRPFDLKTIKKRQSANKDQWRAFAAWLEDHLGDGKPWVMGDTPGLADINSYMNIWYLVHAFPAGANLYLEEFPFVRAWRERMVGKGHGDRRDLAPADALDIAKHATPEMTVAQDPHDPIGRAPGDRVAVTPEDYGKDPVVGKIVSSSSQHIALKREDPDLGELVVHFPRAGYVVDPI